MSLGVSIVIGVLALLTAVSTWFNFRLHRDRTKIRQQLALLQSRIPEPDDEPSANDSNHSETEQQNKNEDILEGSLAKSHIARTGLTQGTAAPNFQLPRIDGGEISLQQYRGQKVLLVFSAPDCGPCNLLAPELQKLARRTPDIQVIMVSRGDLEANQLKAKEYGLTFPIVLQRHWEISRKYAMFATPIAYLIDEHGIVAADVAVGPSQILNLLVGSAIMSLLDGQRVS